ncbi:PHD finger-containing protein 5-like [Humulus lupulus]|uniref:PHD finger-containing protein 5-like n=1 Tax=Humulus lupulus TaxID=3486 RepID=UPI002B414BB6|nr:PHD finger-containing protein 5-like [Humulus lupulus]
MRKHILLRFNIPVSTGLTWSLLIEKVCEICGGKNPRSEFLLVTCSVCNTTCEHVYCMGRKVKHEVPQDWVCESCLTGSDSISMESEERVALESFQEDEAVTRAIRNEQFSGTTVARLSTFNESKDMAHVIARSHGGDGGGCDPPRGPSDISTDC